MIQHNLPKYAFTSKKMKQNEIIMKALELFEELETDETLWPVPIAEMIAKIKNDDVRESFALHLIEDFPWCKSIKELLTEKCNARI